MYKERQMHCIILVLCLITTIGFCSLAWADITPEENNSEVGEQITGIKLTTAEPVEFAEHAGGQWATDSNRQEYYLYDDVCGKIYKTGTKLIITDKDGNEKKYECVRVEGKGFCFQSEDGDLILTDSNTIRLNDNQRTNHWELGNTYNVEVEYMGKKCSVPVTIVKNPVQSISLKLAESIELAEHAEGQWATDIKGTYYYYHGMWGKIFKKGTELTITYTDGKKKNYKYVFVEGEDWCFQSENGELISTNKDNPFQLNDNQETEHWELGNTYSVDVEYMGKTCSIPVSIVENPVQSISIKLAEPVEFAEHAGGQWRTDGNGDQYYRYTKLWWRIFKKGTELTVTDKDGNDKIYKYTLVEDEGWNFQSENGDIISANGNDLQVNDDQYANHWEVGNTYSVDVEYMGKTCSVPVTIVENPVQSISIKLAEPVEFAEHAGGQWRTDGNGDQYYRYTELWWRIFKKGTELTVTDKDGNDKIYKYTIGEDEGWNFQSENGDIISANGNVFRVNDDQYTNHWEVGNTYSVDVEYMGKKCSVPVTIVENPVQSINIKLSEPIEFAEHAGGQWYTDENDDKYYCYTELWWRIFKKGTELTVTDKDGNDKIYKYTLVEDEGWNFQSENGDIISANGNDLQVNDDQYANHWEVGNTYSVDVEYMGKTCSIPVSIVENPVQSISIKLAEPVEFAEHAGGQWRTDGNGDQYYRYTELWWRIFKNVTELTVTDKDGNDKIYKYTIGEDEGWNFQSENGDIISANGNVFRVNDDQYTNHWEVGNTYSVDVEYMGKKCSVPVTIVENPVQSINIKLSEPIEFAEHAGGQWYTDENDDKYYCYTELWWRIFKNVTELTVTDKDGNDKIYKYTLVEGEGWNFQSEDGNKISAEGNDFRVNDDQYANHWEVGNTYSVDVEYMGKTCSVPVTIVENPVQSIRIKLAEPVEFAEHAGGQWYTDENDDKYYCYTELWWRIFKKGTELTVTYNGGTEKQYTYTFVEGSDWCFKSESGDTIYTGDEWYFRIHDDQYTNHWEVGNTYSVDVEYMGKKDSVPVTIVENPVQSIRLNLTEPIELAEHAYGQWNTDENGDQYYHYTDFWWPIFKKGTELTVTDKDGNDKIYKYTFVEGEGWNFQSEDGNKISANGNDFQVNDDQYTNHWEIGNTYSVDVEYMGRTTTFPIVIVENPVHSIYFIPASPISIKENSNYSWEKDEKGNEYKCYYWTDRDYTGDKLVVNKKDETTTYIGKVDPITDETYFENEKGERIKVFVELYFFDNQEVVHWSAGKTYDVTVEYLGAETKIPVYLEKVTSGSLPGTGGGGGGGAVFPPATDNVTNSGTSGTDNATTSADLSDSTSTSNGTTSATVDKSTADKIVDKAVANKSEEIVIDATANSTTAVNSTNTAQVTIPTDTLEAIAEKTEADITIKTDVAEVKLDNATAAAVAQQAEGDTVQIVAEKVKEDATEVHFELKVVCSGGKVISDFKGGSVAVTVALPKTMAEKNVVCVYIDENGYMSKMEGHKNADGTYTFVTGHFSSYVLLAEEEADGAIAAQKEEIKNIDISLRTKITKSSTGKKGIKLTWKADTDAQLDGIEVFRSTKSKSGYKRICTTKKAKKNGYYINTKSLKKNTKYYYKVKGYVLIDGEKIYTDYSSKGIRTFK